MATIGLDRLYYAKITESEDGEETYGVPSPLAKAMKADLSIELAEAILYADDGAAEVIKDFKSGNGAMSGYDAAKNEPYFRAAWKNAVELCVILCKKYGLRETDIICHSEGHKKGIASNHGDVMHWFPKHGENMDTFRAAVKKELAVEAPPAPAPNPAPATLYRVRRNWSDAKSQKGAFQELDNAKRCTDQNPGYSVFNEKGVAVYSGRNEPAYETYTVRKGDTLWDIAAAKMGSGARYHEIMALNGLTSDTIHAGQALKLPR